MNEYLACYHSFPGWDGALGTAPSVVWALILSDAGISVSYIVLAWGLIRYFADSRSPFRTITILFALFIGFCGITHAVKIAVFFVPAFWAEAIVQWITLAFSLAAAGLWMFKYRATVEYALSGEELRARFPSLEKRVEKIEREVD